MALAKIYIGCNCKETWRVAYNEHIDTDRDDVEGFLYCTICYKQVSEVKKENGVECYHALTPEEIQAEHFKSEE